MIPKKFKINRKEWLRGEGHSDSSLLRLEDQKMCCLGFYALAKGINKKHIECIPCPDELVCKNGEPMMKEMVNDSGENNSMCQYLMEANDCEDMQDNKREFIIKEQFAKLGVEVEFYN